jgi:hypothetical protein
MVPAAGLEPGLTTGVVEESLAVPAELDRDLREEQTSGSAPLDEDAMVTHNHVFGRGGAKRREDRDLYPHMRKLVESEWREAGVLERGSDGIVPYRPPQRRYADYVTNAAAQPTVDLEGDERSSDLKQDL